MKQTLSLNRAVIRVDSIATGNVDNVLKQDNNNKTFFVDLSDGAAKETALDAMRVISRTNGKHYYSFEDILKKNIVKAVAKEYVAPVGEVWEATPMCICNKANTMLGLEIGIESPYLESRDGMHWGHKDIFIEVNTNQCGVELDCKKFGVHQNHLLVRAIYKNYLEGGQSEFYTMSIKHENNNLNDLAAVDAWIKSQEAVNIDEEAENNSKPLTIVLTAKVEQGNLYAELENNYVYPRGTKLMPVFKVGDQVVATFTKKTDMKYEVGSGYDLRAEEFDVMSYHTNLNTYPKLSDGTASPELVYQIENNKNYHTVTVEYSTPKTLKGEEKYFIITFATTETSILNKLKTIFGIA